MAHISQIKFVRDTPRSRAHKAGEAKYLGEPCRRKHSGIRYTSSGECVDCAPLKNARNRERRIEKKRKDSYIPKAVAAGAALIDNNKILFRVSSFVDFCESIRMGKEL